MITPSFGLTATERVLPKLALDFTTASLDSRITFTRTTGASNPATYVNSSGVITAATNNQPRFDYNPTTLVCKGLLIEESRANLATYSQDFTNGGVTGWGAVNLTPSADTTVSPDGTQNADSLFETATNAQHRLDKATTIAAGAYVFSCFLKTAGSRYASLRIGGLGAYIDLNTGVATNVGATSVAVDVFPNGWYRLSIYVASAALNDTIRINNNGANAGIASTYAGNPANAIVVWGAQFEAGAFATSYIPTTTTALTRNADVATMTGTNFSDWYNQTAGTLVTQMRSVQGYPNIGASVAQDTSNYYNTRNGGTAGTVRTLARTAATFNINTSSSVTTNDVVLKQGIAYAAGAVSAARQGSVYVNNVATTLATGMVQMDIGADNINGPYFSNGHVQKISYWPMKLTNAELAAFTK